jgi:predicted MFS family arabinose efflux permease
MKPPPPSSTVRENVFASIAAGVRFLATDPVLRSVLLMLLVTCLLARPYAQLLPAYAAHVVHVDARGLGFLLASSGLGAICGSFLTAIVGAHRRGRVWFASAIMMAASVVLLGSVRSYLAALPVLAFLGLSVLSFAGSSNVLLQTLSPDDMRGRAISVFSMIILGVVPAGSLVLGSLASVIGIPATLQFGGAVALVVAVAVWSTNPALRAA